VLGVVLFISSVWMYPFWNVPDRLFDYYKRVPHAHTSRRARRQPALACRTRIACLFCSLLCSSVLFSSLLAGRACPPHSAQRVPPGVASHAHLSRGPLTVRARADVAGTTSSRHSR
jgi:hypothetical protein